MTNHHAALPDHRFIELMRDRYSFLSFLGGGATCTVYEARHVQLGRVEAIKALNDSLPHDVAKQIFQAASEASALSHPGILKVFDKGRVGGIYWFSMELVEGPSLSSIIGAGQRLDALSFSRLTVPLLDTLSYCHKHGVLHGNIAPDHVMIQKNGRPCLTDFWGANLQTVHAASGHGSLTGLPEYRAPEQADGAQIDARADLFSLAAIMFHAVVGKPPFPSGSQDGDQNKEARRLPEFDDLDFPAPLKNVLIKALSWNKENRYATADDMLSATKSACDACGIRWNSPLDGFQQLSNTNKKPIEAFVNKRSGDIGLSAATTGPTTMVREPRDRSLALIIIGPLAIVAAMASVLFFRESAKPPQDSVLEVESIVQTEEPQIESILQAPKPSPAPANQPVATGQAQPAPAAPASVARFAVKPPILAENNVPASIAIPPELAGKLIRVRIKVGENGKVQDCTILDKDMSADNRKIANAIVMNMLFTPGLAEDGKPVASQTTIAFSL
jgi:serine/threonine-protein kinase